MGCWTASRAECVPRAEQAGGASLALKGGLDEAFFRRRESAAARIRSSMLRINRVWKCLADRRSLSISLSLSKSLSILLSAALRLIVVSIFFLSVGSTVYVTGRQTNDRILLSLSTNLVSCFGKATAIRCYCSTCRCSNSDGQCQGSKRRRTDSSDARATLLLRSAGRILGVYGCQSVCGDSLSKRSRTAEAAAGQRQDQEAYK